MLSIVYVRLAAVFRMVVAAVPENAIAISCQPREVKTVDFMSPHQIYLDGSTDPLSKLAVADYMRCAVPKRTMGRSSVPPQRLT